MTRENRIPAILFGLTLAMGLIVALACWKGRGEFGSPASSGPSGWVISHAQYRTMEVGGSAAARNGSVFWEGFALALFNLAFFTFCLLLGMRKRSGFGPVSLPLLLVGLGWSVLWAILFWTYSSYMIEPGASRLFGLPVPTAWMLYGAWSYPVLFALYFVFRFRAWFLRDEDLQHFRQLVGRAETGPAEDQE